MTRALMFRGVSMPTGFRLAAQIALVASIAIAAIVSWRAVRLDALPAATTRTVPVNTDGALTPPAVTRSSNTGGRALDNDPFSADRKLTSAPGAVTAQATGSVVPMIPPEAVRLLGTVVRPEGRNFVVYQLPSEVPRTIRIGESVGGMTLVHVLPGRATFRAPGGALVELTLTKPGS